jgi:hypothetical protein
MAPSDKNLDIFKSEVRQLFLRMLLQPGSSAAMI